MDKETKTTSHKHQLRIVESGNERAQIEREIDGHIKGLEALIQRLHPSDRRQYFSGLLEFLLKESVELPAMKKHISSCDHDLSRLSTENLLLIRELSEKLNQLYYITGDVES